MSSSRPSSQPSRVCFTSPWVDVVTVPSGDGAGDEHFVVKTKDYVSVVAVLADGHVLLVRQYRPAVGVETIELPAGHVDDGQTPEEAARQELIEETGHRPGTLEFLGVLHPDTGRLGNRHWVFFATGIEKIGDPTADEVAASFSVDPAELRAMTLDGRFSHAQRLAAVHLAVTAGRLAMPAVNAPPHVPRGGSRYAATSCTMCA